MPAPTTLTCIITSPTGTVRHEGVNAVSLPAFSGRMGILPGHAEAFIVLAKGDAVLEYADGRNEIVKLKDCECHVKDDNVVIIE